ncbi:MAG: DNA-formamidopyrimidine glycosylase family protein [Chloroflexota bacterium]
MPEYPDITIYQERIMDLIVGQRLNQIRVANPFLVRTFDPPINAIDDSVLERVERLGKRIIFGLQGDRFLVLHLMISGRLQWEAAGKKIPSKRGLAGFDFESGTLMLTESSTKKRASLHLVQGRESLVQFERGGLDVFTASLEQFCEIMRAENHTLKRSLTDPTILDGIGNAYSDEILHRAELSPILLTAKISDDELARLYQAIPQVLLEFTERMRSEVGDGFPKKVTAFREDMAVHGKYNEPCPVCETKIQRIKYATNETNYCPTCQTGGKLLADRGLSRLLKKDWPRSMEELETLHSK